MRQQIFLLCLVLAACTTPPHRTVLLDANNYTPPRLLTYLTIERQVFTIEPEVTFSTAICGNIYSRLVWESGNEATQLWEHIVDSASVQVDGRSLTRDELTFVSNLSILILDNEDPHDPLGSITDVKICFDTTHLQAGRHRALVRIPTISGVEYEQVVRFTILEAKRK